MTEKPLRRSFSRSYKREILQQADACTQPGQLGQLLRRAGLYSSHLTAWRKQRLQGELDAATPHRRGRKKATPPPRAAENQRLRRENERLAARLRQAEIIIDVQKKLRQAKLGKGGCFMET
ncbi:MAG: hypothetical protein HW416_3434 [Chloroflexi bacterium]|nr:hypothetical protein [Chloroflexota bacterium]